MENKEIFKELVELNVNDFTEKKGDLTYLSWSCAWQKFKEICPGATYEIKKNADGLPVFGNETTGYMVYTSITVDDLTYEMWLPVMDNRNKTILTPVMTDINKTVMRCLVKNIAMFGLGLYIYAGEDLPTEIDEPITEEQIAKMTELNVNIANTLRYYRVSSVEKLTKKQAEYVIEAKQKAVQDEN